MEIRYMAGWKSVARALESKVALKNGEVISPNLYVGFSLQQAIRQYQLASFPHYRDYWRGQADALLSALGAS